MATSHCIYAGTPLRDDVPSTHPDSRSLEHIIPLSMGGSDDFTTRDVSQAANSRAGSEIDGPLINHMLIAMQRQMLGLTGHSGELPTVQIPISPLVAGSRPGRLDIPPEGEAVPNFPPKVEGSLADAAATGKPLIVEGEVSKARAVAEGLLRQAKAKGLKLASVDGKPLETLEDLLDVGSRSTHDTLHGRLPWDDVFHPLERFALKVSIAYAHTVLGDRFSSSADADRLRRVLWNDKVRWADAGLEGGVGANRLGVATQFNLPARFHVLQLVGNEQGLWALGDLFGKGPFQWALKLSADVGMAVGMPAQRSLLLLDAQTRVVERR